MTFDPTKPVQTRGGRKARIICTDRNCDEWPIMALLENEDGTEGFDCFKKNGQSSRLPEHDLINVSETKSWWIPIIDGKCVGLWGNREALVANELFDFILEIRMCDGKHVETIQHEVEK